MWNSTNPALANDDAFNQFYGKTMFKEQSNIAAFVRNFVVDGHVVLGENEAIYLFELGTTNMSSDAADFQDLVVVVELGESPEALAETEDMKALYD